MIKYNLISFAKNSKIFLESRIQVDCSHPCQGTLDQQHKCPHDSPCHQEHRTGCGASSLLHDDCCGRRSCTHHGSDTGTDSLMLKAGESRGWSHSHVCHTPLQTRTHPHTASEPLHHHKHLSKHLLISTVCVRSSVPRSGWGVPYMQVHLAGPSSSLKQSRHSWSVVLSQL